MPSVAATTPVVWLEKGDGFWNALRDVLVVGQDSTAEPCGCTDEKLPRENVASDNDEHEDEAEDKE